MTEPSQYFKGRTVQEQMNEVIGYVDVRAEEVAAAKADDVLEPAEQAKDDAIAAKEAAEDARDTTLAALPAIQQDIADLKAEDVSLDGRLDTVELKVQTAEGNIVTIQGQIVALQTADGQNVKITAINDYAVGLTGNQDISGTKTFAQPIRHRQSGNHYALEHMRSDIVIGEVSGTTYCDWLKIADSNNSNIAKIEARTYADGHSSVIVSVKNADGTTKSSTIVAGDTA